MLDIVNNAYMRGESRAMRRKTVTYTVNSVEPTRTDN
jgi:hypothetical protein